jgi:hypothetical protein
MSYDVSIVDAVFLRDGGGPVGSVHQVWNSDHSSIVIYIENAGDFKSPSTAIKTAHFGNVILDEAKLDAKMRSTIGHAHDAEPQQ